VLPLVVLFALGGAIFYAYAAPVRETVSLPSVGSVFERIATATAASLKRIAPPPPASAPALPAPTSAPPTPAPVPAASALPPEAPRTPARGGRAQSTSRVTTSALPPSMGLLSVNARPWADVWVDGQPAGTTPLANLRVAVGTHEIVWKHPQLGERRQQVIVTRESPTRIGMNLQTP
jgi:serine/threonine-protein kinase